MIARMIALIALASVVVASARVLGEPPSPPGETKPLRD